MSAGCRRRPPGTAWRCQCVSLAYPSKRYALHAGPIAASTKFVRNFDSRRIQHVQCILTIADAGRGRYSLPSQKRTTRGMNTSGRIVTPTQLERHGTARGSPEKRQPSASPLRCSNDRSRRLAWPSYDRCKEEAIGRGRKRSSADFTFCCIAIDHFKRTPEGTADKLMEVSSKAKENGQDYALGQATRAAENVASIHAV